MMRRRFFFVVMVVHPQQVVVIIVVMRGAVDLLGGRDEIGAVVDRQERSRGRAAACGRRKGVAVRDYQ
jgi:hypothetical protein